MFLLLYAQIFSGFSAWLCFEADCVLQLPDLKMATCQYESLGLQCSCTQLSPAGANKASSTLFVSQIYLAVRFIYQYLFSQTFRGFLYFVEVSFMKAANET